MYDQALGCIGVQRETVFHTGFTENLYALSKQLGRQITCWPLVQDDLMTKVLMTHGHDRNTVLKPDLENCAEIRCF